MTFAAKAYYARAFIDRFMLAAGDALDHIDETNINEHINQIVRRAGTDAGLDFRKHILNTGGL